jgi:hypothetical protein
MNLFILNLYTHSVSSIVLRIFLGLDGNGILVFRNFKKSGGIPADSVGIPKQRSKYGNYEAISINRTYDTSNLPFKVNKLFIFQVL